MTNMDKHCHNNLWPGVIKFTYLENISSVIITIYLVYIIIALGEKKFFKEMIYFHNVTYKSST